MSNCKILADKIFENRYSGYLTVAILEAKISELTIIHQNNLSNTRYHELNKLIICFERHVETLFEGILFHYSTTLGIKIQQALRLAESILDTQERAAMVSHDDSIKIDQLTKMLRAHLAKFIPVEFE